MFDKNTGYIISNISFTPNSFISFNIIGILRVFDKLGKIIHAYFLSPRCNYKILSKNANMG